MEDLKKIKELYEDGVLTEEEFKEQKENVLLSLNNRHSMYLKSFERLSLQGSVLYSEVAYNKG